MDERSSDFIGEALLFLFLGSLYLANLVTRFVVVENAE